MTNGENQENTERGLKRQMTLSDKIKCTFWSVIVLLFCLWMSSAWPLVLLPFVVDLYWTHYNRWDWWKSIENKFLRELMSWVDAIVFAIVAVWVLQNFFFQNFQIPTTSLEKTMMAGDYLLVSKYHYGPRIPMTPLSLPIFQHTITLGSKNLCKSYIEKPQLGYRRMPGLGQVSRGDIVVFNYPMGDSIMVNHPEEDYYQSKHYLMNVQGYSQEQFDRIAGPVFCRPVDRCENYVKRCIGLPGETLLIKERQVYIDGEAMQDPVELQQMRLVYTKAPNAVITNTYWHNLGVYTRGNGSTLSPDVYEYSPDQVAQIAPFLHIEPDSISGKYNHLYRVNLTVAKAEKLAEKQEVAWVIYEPMEMQDASGVFPKSKLFHWHHNNFGPLWIPKRGESIDLTPETEALYGRCIRVYEHNTLTRDAQGQYLLNGEPASSYTFQMDYYWMMGDNRDNSLDSRFWGFVPESHIVGTPLFVWISIDQETGQWRWDRLFKKVKGL